MIKDVKIEGMDAFKQALVAMKESAGSGLPEITESDEGKILKVEEGAAAWGEVESGSSLVYEDSVFHDVGDYKYTVESATIIQKIKTYVLPFASTKYAKNFDIALPTEGPYFSQIISAYATCTYNSIPINIPCIILRPEGTTTQTCLLCFDSADGQFDVPNNGIYIDKIFITGYGPANP